MRSNLSSTLLWQLLEQGSEEPGQFEMEQALEYFDAILEQILPEQRLELGAAAIVQLADITHQRAMELLQEWQDINSSEGTTVSTDLFSGLVRRSMRLDLEDLIQEFVSPPLSRWSKRDCHSDGRTGESVASVVDRKTALELAEPPMTADRLKALAGEETVQQWSEAIAQHINGCCRLSDLQEKTSLSIVELWLGSLLGGYHLEQRGKFYDTEAVWVSDASRS